MNIPFFVIAPLTILAIIIVVLSKIFSIAICKKNGKSKMLEEIYAYLTFIEFVNRTMFLGYLWFSPKILAFSVNFMVLVCTSVVGIFFYTLYLQPILIHSPHFKGLMKAKKCAFIFVIGGSFVFGVNFVRILYARVFGSKGTANDFNDHYFFVKPLNTLANFNIIFLAIQIVLCMVTLFIFVVSNGAWTIGIMGIALNFALIVCQLIKICHTRKFMKRYHH